MSNNILFVTRDLSYPGGSERFVLELLKFLAKEYKGKLNIQLLETEGSGKFANIGIYAELINSGVKHLKPIEDIGGALNINKVEQLKKYVENSAVVFSFLFNADFLIYQALYGNSAIQAFIKSCVNKGRLLSAIPELKDYENKSIEKMKRVPEWVSIKFCDFSIALEQETKQWKDRKELIDTELEPIVAAKHNYIVTVASNVENKWKRWNKKTIQIPCTSISAKDLKAIARNKSKISDLKKKYNLNEEEIIILSVSRIEPGKGVRKLLAAFKRLRKDKRVSMLLVGSGSLLDSLKNENTDSNILFLGQKERKEVLEIMCIADVFCIFSESEGLPLSLQEAMACSMPVVATNVGGIEDLVTDKENGLLIDSKSSIGKISDTLKRVINLDRKGRNSMAVSSKKIIQNKFTSDVAFKSYKQLIDKLI